MFVKAEYIENDDGRLHWCNSHGRMATHVLVQDGERKKPVCAPGLGGILLPCFTVDLTDEVEITYSS